MSVATVALAMLLALVACQVGFQRKLADLTLTLSPTTLTTGNNRVDLFITDAFKSPVLDAVVTCELLHRTMKMEKNVVTATHKGDGHYTAILSPSMPGSWAIFVEVIREGKSLGRAEFSVLAQADGLLPGQHIH